MTDGVSKSSSPGRVPDNPTRPLPPIVHHRRARGQKAMPRLLSIKQATFELGISRTCLYELIATGNLKTVKIRRRRFVTVEAIEEFIAGLSA
jgi:excisionase family DNA binding protein